MAKIEDNRVPSQNVVNGSTISLPAGHRDLLFLRRGAATIGDAALLADSSYLDSFQNLVSQDPSISDFIKGDEDEIFEKPDVPELTDIESVTYEQYYDAATKSAKYKVVVKIRNSSVNKTDVVGVDARIYNPLA